MKRCVFPVGRVYGIRQVSADEEAMRVAIDR